VTTDQSPWLGFEIMPPAVGAVPAALARRQHYDGRGR
jgi:hypothetical protein